MNQSTDLSDHSIGTLLAFGAQQLAGDPKLRLFESQVLLAHTLGKQRSFLHAWPEHVVLAGEAEAYIARLRRRKAGVPIAYLLGYREFWSRRFVVNESTLIPRPETELLVETALNVLPKDTPLHVADLGTGSGCIAISIALERPQCSVVATDISADTLATARTNAQLHQCDNLDLRLGDWLAPLHNEKFALIVSNPPYIAEQDWHVHHTDIAHEPRRALTSGPSGLTAIREICSLAPKFLHHRGALMIEHGFDQGPQVAQIFEQHHFQEVHTYQDHAAHPRVTVGTWL